MVHDKCNNAKSGYLAAGNHLAAWIERNTEHQAELQVRLVQQQWIRTRAMVLPIIAVDEPLAIWWPRDATPDCDALSWHVTQRQ